MDQKSIAIIGAGAAGLCTGIYAQLNGYQTRIFEMHDIPGGLLTAWKRRGFTIDGCLHSLVGSGPGFHMHRYWQEVGMLDGRQFVYPDRLLVYHGEDGRVFNLYCDPDRLEKHMLELSPRDAAATKEFIEGLRFGIRFNPPMVESYEAGAFGEVRQIFSIFPQLRDLQKWTKLTLGEVAQRFQDPLIRNALNKFLLPDFSALIVLMTMAYVQKRQSGFPLGGSLPLALALEKRYKELGGQVQYRSRVAKVLTEDNRAVGIRLEDGSEHQADVVISASDGHATIFKLLEGKYVNDAIRTRFETWKTFPPLVYVALGVNCTFPEVPHSTYGNLFALQEPLNIAGQARSVVYARVYNFDPHFAPAGKTLLVMSLDTDYAYWKSLAADRQAYEAEKEAVAQTLIGVLDCQWPGFSTHVEMCDVATPVTYERYTGNWKGAYEGWLLTPDKATAKIPKSLPGLDHFWMVGQWVYPGGGLPGGVATAREVIWQQCKKDGKRFRA
jgi:phytoene dehydrogenase-like protein